MPPYLDVRNVTHSYNEKLVLRNIDCAIDRGDRWALLGPSGAGKTTLLEIVTGLTPPNRDGTVLREGEEQINLAKWRRNVGWLSTDLLDRIPDRQSVVDTVIAGKHSQTLKAERSGLSYSRDDEEQARTLLDQVNLRDTVSQRFTELSQGQRQLVLVARSLMGNPDLLILDEPCAGLDPGRREQFLTILDGVLSKQNELTVIYVTHHVEEILPAFTKLLVLKDGETIYSGDKESFMENGSLEGVYREDFEIVNKNGRYWPVGTP